MLGLMALLGWPFGYTSSYTPPVDAEIIPNTCLRGLFLLNVDLHGRQDLNTALRAQWDGGSSFGGQVPACVDTGFWEGVEQFWEDVDAIWDEWG